MTVYKTIGLKRRKLLHGTRQLTIQSALNFTFFLFLCKAGASNLLAARINIVIVSWFATAGVKATISGIHNNLNYYVIMEHVYV